MAKIEEAIVDLLLNHGTFYASLLSQMTRVEDKKTQTLSTQVKNGRITLRYNPDYVDPRSMKETKALLEHECLHVVMEHTERFKDKEHQVAQVATDVAINQMIQHLPPEALTVDNVFQGKANRDESAEYYYDLIQKNPKLKKELFGDGKPKGCGCKFEDGDGNEVDKELRKEVIKQMVKEAVDTTNKNGGRGTLPLGLEKYLEELFKPAEIGWRQLLRQFVANSVKSGSKASWKKPSRRYGEMQKGRIADRMISLVVAIDTSGSINDEMLTQFIDEIKGIQASYKSNIHMIECDADIQKYYKLSRHGKVDRKIKGGGGTDFAPVFEYVKKKNIKCDAMIFFTDLCGSFPDKKPHYPVLWGYYNCYGGSVSDMHVPFGKVVTLKINKKGDKE